ncbi:MAG: PaaI family thioesterase [Candidatus Aminicenantes bacterium]|nr:PaaI family thioesterase [Candidatus Aminicenantes bacterium]
MKLTEKFNLPDVVRLPHRSFFLTGLSLDCLKIEQFFNEKDNSFIMWFYPGKKAMGPPGYCHGGLISTILDESMGSCCWLNGHLVMTVKIEVRYKAKIPVNKEYISTSGIDLIKGRRIFAEAEIVDSNNKVYALAKGTFLAIPPEKLEFPPEYAREIERAVHFIKLRQQGLPVEEIFKAQPTTLENPLISQAKQ